MHTLQRTGLFGIMLFENSFKIPDAHLSLSLSLSLSLLVDSAIFPTDGACEFPLDLRGDWYTTSNGVVTFSNQSISNFKSLTHPSAQTFTCEYIDNDRYITRWAFGQNILCVSLFTCFPCWITSVYILIHCFGTHFLRYLDKLNMYSFILSISIYNRVMLFFLIIIALSRYRYRVITTLPYRLFARMH